MAGAHDTVDETDDTDEGGSGDNLSWDQRRFLAALGAPALGMALIVTVVSTSFLCSS
jgi:hypothetical protein